METKPYLNSLKNTCSQTCACDPYDLYEDRPGLRKAIPPKELGASLAAGYRNLSERATSCLNFIPLQAISGENFSQSEYVAFGAISQFALPPLAKAIHRAFDYVNLSNLCSKRAFHSINLSNVGFIIESQSVRIHISFQQKPINKLRFEPEISTDPYAFARID